MEPIKNPPAATRAFVLTDANYALLLRPSGAGLSCWSGDSLSRWSGDPLRADEGFLWYVCDLDDGSVWSPNAAPFARTDADVTCSVGESVVSFERTVREIRTRLEIRVIGDVDVRCLTLENASPRNRRLQVTTYIELALCEITAFAAHPGFRQLFVETEAEAASGLLFARRRPRGADEASLWCAHGLAGPGELEYETDRAVFLGRGRDLRRPAAMHGHAWSGRTGSVLDPVFAQRRTVSLPPGGKAEFIGTLTAGATRAAVAGRALSAQSNDRVGSATALSASSHSGQFGKAKIIDALVANVIAADAAVPSSPPFTKHRYRPAVASQTEVATLAPGDALHFDNGIGGFSPNGREYVLRLLPDADGTIVGPPLPWTNVIANETFGFLVSERGAGCTWSGNSRENRLTPWRNDAIIDPHDEALFIRDEERGIFWSPQPGPCPARAEYEVRHGFGYSSWRARCHDLEQSTTTFVAVGAPVRITRLDLRNLSAETRRLSVYAYAQLVLGDTPECTAEQVECRVESAAGLVLARNPQRGAFSDWTAFAGAFAVDGMRARHVATDRSAFLGTGSDIRNPDALSAMERLPETTAREGGPCAAFQLVIEIAPYASASCVVLLGECADDEQARRLHASYVDLDAVADARAAVDRFWEHSLGALTVRTPSPAIDTMLNGWLLYQALSCRLWGRTAFYQSGGAFGFRDQLQDATAFLLTDPNRVRAQILLHAAHQFEAGDVLHWWHPPSERGLRTKFADDLLWLPYVTAQYLHATDDRRLLDEPAGFVVARALADDEDEVFLQTTPSGTAASVWEHCCLALERSLTCGAHGLPLMGTGDWNDGMNRVGRLGRGESVWLGFFLYAILEDFIALAATRGEANRAARWRQYRHELAAALEAAGWDGAWYRRAYYDDGTAIGSAASDECRIDGLAQAWSVLSRAAPADRAWRAIESAAQQLVDEAAGMIRLLTPPFDQTPHDPGYIKGYVPGIRENGGQYTHAAAWVVRAAAELGQRARAARWFAMLTPIQHTTSAAAVALYKVEPYVVAADVYGVDPHVGRGGWTWYTGSAAWMYRVGVESILGLTVADGRLRVRPCIPDEWRGFSIRYRRPDARTVYAIEVVNADKCSARVIRVVCDQVEHEPVAGFCDVALVDDGNEHTLRVELGDAS